MARQLDRASETQAGKFGVARVSFDPSARKIVVSGRRWSRVRAVSDCLQNPVAERYSRRRRFRRGDIEVAQRALRDLLKTRRRDHPPNARDDVVQNHQDQKPRIIRGRNHE